MKKVLLTGAVGFIGSHLSELLLNSGYEVIGYDNFDPFYPRSYKERNLEILKAYPHFTLVEADLRDRDAVMQTMEAHRPDGIIHLAAKAGVRPSIQDPVAYTETNITGTLNLLLACEKYPIEHFTFASSSSVYGNASKVPFSEEDATSLPESPYAATKKAGELLCFTYHQLLKLPITCLRFFTVYGPRQRPDLAIHKFVKLIDADEPIPFFGDGTTSRDYTFVADTVKGIKAAHENPDGYQIYNLGRSNPVSLNEMVATIERAMGKSAILKRMPDQQGDVTITYADVSKAHKRLGYAPEVDFEEGVRRFAAWWHEAKADLK